MMIGNVMLNVALRMISPQTLSSNPACRMIKKYGATKITGGAIRCERNQVVRLPFWGRKNRKRAIPYAARVPRTKESVAAPNDSWVLINVADLISGSANISRQGLSVGSKWSQGIHKLP